MSATHNVIHYCPIHGDLLAAPRSHRCANAPKGHEYTYLTHARAIDEMDPAESGYTPTTDEVRQSFVYAESSEFVATVPGKGEGAWTRVPAEGDVKATRVRNGKIHAEATAEFDLWLTKHDADVVREASEKAWDRALSERFLQTGGSALELNRARALNPFRREEA